MVERPGAHIKQKLITVGRQVALTALRMTPLGCTTDQYCERVEYGLELAIKDIVKEELGGKTFAAWATRRLELKQQEVYRRLLANGEAAIGDNGHAFLTTKGF